MEGGLICHVYLWDLVAEESSQDPNDKAHTVSTSGALAAMLEWSIGLCRKLPQVGVPQGPCGSPSIKVMTRPSLGSGTTDACRDSFAPGSSHEVQLGSEYFACLGVILLPYDQCQ